MRVIHLILHGAVAVVLSVLLNSARNVVAAALKRLAHRNPNVQLYTFTLVEALSKNCGLEVNREIASRAFTQGLEKLVTDRVCASRNDRISEHRSDMCLADDARQGPEACSGLSGCLVRRI